MAKNKSAALSIISSLFNNDKDTTDQFLSGSISNYTRDLIMTFPVLCDNSLPPSTASMINRANERNIATMLRMIFASMQLNGTDGKEVLSRIHKNINSNMSLDDFMDFIEDKTRTLSGALGYHENASLDGNINRAEMLLTKALKTPEKQFPVESFSERSLNEYTVLKIGGKRLVKEAPEDFDDDLGYNTFPQSLPGSAIGYQQDELNNAHFSSERQRAEAQRSRNNIVYDRNKDGREETKIRMQQSSFERENITTQLLDSDVKKCNEMAPTLLVVNYNQVDTNGNLYKEKSFVAGVKSRLISVDSSDIIERCVEKNKTKVSFLNFIRSTTGEIKFLRDFVLCINQAKISAKNAVKKGPNAKIWNTLQNRSTKNEIKKIQKKGNDASAITVLVINQEIVNLMNKEYDFDIENLKNARMILEAYNLLGIVICNESVSVAKFLYAGNDSWETQAYSYLEKESNDKSYREVINLIGKMGR